MMKAPSKASGVEAEFASRIDRIRARYGAKLAEGFGQTDANLLQMTGEGSHATHAIETTYRWLHDVTGIGPTLGFVATGDAARTCADIMINAFRSGRSLTSVEMESLNDALASLRIAALRETISAESIQRPSL